MEERIHRIEEALYNIQSILLGNKKTLSLEDCCSMTGYSKSYMYKLASRLGFCF